MGLQLTGRIETGIDLLDSDLRDLQIVTGAGGTFLYAATGRNGGFSVWRPATSGGLASLADTAYFSAGSGLGPNGFAAITLDGTARLVPDGRGAGRLLSYDIEADGGLAKPAAIDLPGRGTAAHSALTATALADGTTALYRANALSGVLEAYVSTGTGTIADQPARRGGAAAFALEGEVSLATATVAGTGFLLAADAGAQGLRSYRIAPASGALKAIDSIGPRDGLGVAAPAALEVVTAFGATWVILAASTSSSLSVLKLLPTGQLTAADHLIDSLGTRFGGVQALEVIRAGDRVFVLAGGADDGLSLLTLLPGGQLLHLQSLAHEKGRGLENVTAIEAVRVGDALQIFVTSGTTPGVTQFSLSLKDLGVTIRDTGADAAANLRLDGGPGDDLIVAGPGRDTLRGQGGDDILVSGPGGSTLTGGDGADLFVLQPGSDKIQITDFEAGSDRIDLTRFPMLRSADQLTVQEKSDGIRLYLGTNRIEIYSRDDAPLTPADLWPGGAFGTPDRVLVLDPARGETLRGTAGNDVLKGSPLNDTITARAGHDRIAGGAGNDRILAGAGRDTSLGEAGRDRLLGGKGADTLDGGAGRDRLLGSKGADTLDGGAGRDKLLGGKGADTLTGGAGRDRLTGGGGGDTFVFGPGHGRDRIVDFTAGQDRIRLEIAGTDGISDLTMTRTVAGTRIDTGDGTLVLTDLRPGDLDAGDFLFG